MKTFENTYIVPRYSTIRSRKECSLDQTVYRPEFIGESLHMRIPIIASNMDTIVGERMVDKMFSLGGLAIRHRYQTLDDIKECVDAQTLEGINSNKVLAFSVGSIHTDKEITKLDWILDHLSNREIKPIICVDMAHGHSLHMKDTLIHIRQLQRFEGIVIAGNVVTEKAVRDLHYWGADIIKVGIAGGSVCRTRNMTGVGLPQLEAVYNCSNVFENGKRIPIIADGGIKEPKDAALCLALGAKFVMIGGMLAGTDYTPNWFSGGYDLEYRGMASKEAKESGKKDPNYIEGQSIIVHRQGIGSTENVINNICDGIKSAMSYTGARTLEEFANFSNVYTL